MSKKEVKILLLNSDLAKNRGDRAIAQGNIELFKELYPNCKITGLSENPERDSKWFGINFLNMDSQSLSPIDFINLYKEAKKSDYIFWGGGEILKDYTNKAALWYWWLKISLLKKANDNIYGVFQGIGPTKSNSSKKIIVKTVGKCKNFIVRDDESKNKLINWGAKKDNIYSSSDPAILSDIDNEITNDLYLKLEKDNINKSFLKNYIIIGPRSWFHYKKSGIIPFKYKKKVKKLLNISENNKKTEKYKQQLAKITEEIIEKYDFNIIFLPMHMSEDDTKLAEFIKKKSEHKNKIRILAHDIYSPNEIRKVMSQAENVVSFRLHSAIIGTSENTPALTIYYVDKGRVYFEQIKQDKYSIPIEKTIEANFSDLFFDKYDKLVKNSESIKNELKANVQNLRKDIVIKAKKALPKNER